MTKLAFITGSTYGLGFEVARAFALSGYDIVLNARAECPSSLKALEEIRALGHSAHFIPANLSEPQCGDLIADALLKLPTSNFCVLVNNVGRAEDCPLLPFDENKWLDQITLNFLSAMRCIQSLHPLMNRERAAIINTSSIRALPSSQRFDISAYCYAKSLLNSATVTLARQLAPSTTVNAVMPGVLDSDYAHSLPAAQIDAWISATPQKRLIPPSEVANLFVCLAETRSITGQLIAVDGGLSLAPSA